MHAKWGGDLEMAEYLRPSTLFQPSKFPGYLEGANAWNRAGRPARKNGKWEREGDVQLMQPSGMRHTAGSLAE